MNSFEETESRAIAEAQLAVDVAEIALEDAIKRGELDRSAVAAVERAREDLERTRALCRELAPRDEVELRAKHEAEITVSLRPSVADELLAYARDSDDGLETGGFPRRAHPRLAQGRVR